MSSSTEGKRERLTARVRDLGSRTAREALVRMNEAPPNTDDLTNLGRVEVLRLAKAERARRHLYHFVRDGWHVLHPDTPFIDAWHVEAVCLHLEAVTNGLITRLLINEPPGFAKSLTCSVFWAAWTWLKSPHHQWLMITHSQRLTLRDAVKCRKVVQSDWYQETFRPTQGYRVGMSGEVPGWTLASDQNVKSEYSTTEEGARFSMSVGTKITGWRGHTIVIDDSLDANDRHNRAAIERVNEWYDDGVWNRLHDQKRDAIVHIGHRIAEDDLCGHLMDSDEEWDVLCLPNEYDPATHCTTSIGWSDPRTTPGQLLCEDLLDQETTERLKSRPIVYATQYLQSPIAADGNVWRGEWWRFWTPHIPTAGEVAAGFRKRPSMEDFDEVFMSIDASGGSKRSHASHNVLEVWGVLGADRFLLDEERGRWEYPELKDNLLAFLERWPEAHTILVEDKALGRPLIQELKRTISGITPVTPRGDKISRAEAVSPQIRSGNVYLPDPRLFPWVASRLQEYGVFPRGAANDRVDTTSQALQYCAEEAARTFKARAIKGRASRHGSRSRGSRRRGGGSRSSRYTLG